MNSKDRKLLNLQMLTKRVERNLIDRRAFIKGSVALGLTATTAMLLYQAYDGGANAVGTVSAQGRALIRKLPIIERKLPNNLYQAYLPTEGESAIFIGMDMSRPDVALAAEAIKQELEDPVGGGVEYSTLDSGFDPAKEQDNMDAAISRNVDIIYTQPIDPAGAADGIKRARENGQIVCNWISDSLRRPTYKEGFDFIKDGRMVGEHMGSHLSAGSKVVGAVGDGITTMGIDRQKGFKDAVADAGLELVAFEQGHGWTQDGGYEMGKDLLSRFPDIQGMFGGDDQGALGFHKAAEEAGRRQDILIAGADGFPDGQAALVDGRLDMTVTIRRQLEPQAINFAYLSLALLRGGVHGDAFELAHIFDTMAVTKENLAEALDFAA